MDNRDKGDKEMLDDIGFYTLSEKRAREVSWTSNLKRCELILTDRCNFKCPYCRGIKKDARGDLSFNDAINIISTWAHGNLENIRFSGGEPTLYNDLIELVSYSKNKGINRIALSTNGSADLEYYYSLVKAGVNDFSISLDSCCSSTSDIMTGVKESFYHIVNNIKELSKMTYVTVGVVLTEQNNKELLNIINYATALGVSDIRIIPSAQSNHFLNINTNTAFPILKYRLTNINNGRHIRGIRKNDCSKCHLVKDDMVVLNNYHYPCVIYMREQGAAINTFNNKTLLQIREERENWFNNHNTKMDSICSKNCLDVCIDYNNSVEKYQGGNHGRLFW